jgi:hypothetical protein
MLVRLLCCGWVCASAPRCATSGRTAVAASAPQNERRVKDGSFVVIVSLLAGTFLFGIITMVAAMCSIRASSKAMLNGHLGHRRTVYGHQRHRTVCGDRGRGDHRRR